MRQALRRSPLEQHWSSDRLPWSEPRSTKVDDIEISLSAESSAGADWDSFVRTNAGSFYHSFGWRRLNEERFGHATVFLEARSRGELTGVLPLVLTRSVVFGRILCSMPFVYFGGPIAADGRSKLALIDGARQVAAELGADYLELRCAEPLETDVAPSLHKVSMTIELDAEPERLWSAFSSKHRTQVRRVFKDGMQVTSGGPRLLSAFYGVMQQSFRDHGTPLYSREFFSAIMNEFPTETRIFVCSRGAEVLAVAFNAYYGDTVEGMWAGTTKNGHDMHANYALYWEMIKDACERGCRRFHLGRSTVGSGGEQFKKKWNAETRQLYWYYYQMSGDRSAIVRIDNPKFRLAIATWRKLPLWATRVIGPPLARVIP